MMYNAVYHPVKKMDAGESVVDEKYVWQNDVWPFDTIVQPTHHEHVAHLRDPQETTQPNRVNIFQRVEPNLKVKTLVFNEVFVVIPYLELFSSIVDG